METKEYIAALRREGGALAAAADGRLGAAVPSCPEWNVGELVWHMGYVHNFWREIVARQLQDPDVARPPRPPDDELVAWFADGVERAATVLEGADPATPVWTFAPQRDVAFVQRRMAQETAVHRVDGELAVGDAGPVETHLALDGIDEFLTFMLSGRGGLGEGGESVHLHATDGPGEWVVEVGEGEVVIEREHRKADVAVRAPASDLLLLLWRRVSPDAVEVLGDGGALRRFLGRTTL